MKTRALAFVLVVAAAPAWASYEDFRDGRIRLAEPGVTLQRASEASAEEAQPNLPLLPGDRVWTDFSGRAEFQFAEGSVVRLDTRSKLDYVAHDDGRERDVIVLSLWSGSLYLHARDERGRSDFRIETPEGVVDVREGGAYRVDVARGELRLSVYEGEAVIESGRRHESVRRGERASASRGEEPSRAEAFDDWREQDAFARWDAEQGDPRAWAGDSRRYLPDEILPYASDFEGHGTWQHEVEVGYVWRPRVAAGWRPYSDGRWVWSSWGWTWVPYERWGWAPSHYGRWGHSFALGWYWIPDRHWGPGWVTWAVGGDYVGWCPLGWRNRPVYVGRGHAVPRGHADLGGSNAWVYAHRERLGARDVAQRRASVGDDHVRALRLIDPERARLTRELRQVDADSSAAPRGAVPRHVRLRPSPGDSVPELRADPKTTIPDAAARRGVGRNDDGRRRYEREDRGAPGRDERAQPSPGARVRPGAHAEPAERETTLERRATDRPGRVTPDRRPPEWTRPRAGSDETPRARKVRPPEPAEPTTERERRDRRDSERGATSRDSRRSHERRDEDSGVLGRFFRPLSGGDETSRGEERSPRVRPRDEGARERSPERERSGDERPSWRPRDDDAGSRRAPERAQPQTREPRSESGAARRGAAASRRPPKDHD